MLAERLHTTIACISASSIPAAAFLRRASPRVCVLFFTIKRGKGTGLGLSISQTFVRSHDGEIRIERVQPNCGTRVTIALRLRRAEVVRVDEGEEHRQDHHNGHDPFHPYRRCR